MKRMFLCAALAALMMLSGCAGMKIQRGLDASGAFLSSAAPTVTVQPAEGFTPVATGRTTCFVPVENAALNSVPALVWYALYKGENSQLAVSLADCSYDWEWNISAIGVEYQYKPLLYKFYGEGNHDANVHVYTRLVEQDPWMPVLAKSGSSWEGASLIARYEWISMKSSMKLIAEYREPAPELAEGFAYPSNVIGEFLQRSQKAFRLAGVQAPVNVTPMALARISDNELAPVLGSVVQPLRDLYHDE